MDNIIAQNILLQKWWQKSTKEKATHMNDWLKQVSIFIKKVGIISVSRISKLIHCKEGKIDHITLTASVQPNKRLIKDFHCKNPSSDCPICTIFKSHKYWTVLINVWICQISLCLPKMLHRQIAALQEANLQNLHNLLSKCFLIIQSGWSVETNTQINQYKII